MKELDSHLRELVAAVRAAYQPTLAHDALVRAAIVELTQLEEAQPAPVPARGSSPGISIARVVPKAAPPAVTVAAATEQALVAILRAEHGDARISDAFDRKEAELRALFCAVAPLEAAALRKRLADSSDPLAQVFSRLTAERRGRLLAVLGDARRREALLQARAQRGAR